VTVKAGTTTPVTSVRFYYSTTNGATWYYIGQDTTKPFQLSWTVPSNAGAYRLGAIGYAANGDHDLSTDGDIPITVVAPSGSN
jgi:hypothetical protein